VLNLYFFGQQTIRVIKNKMEQHIFQHSHNLLLKQDKILIDFQLVTGYFQPNINKNILIGDFYLFGKSIWPSFYDNQLWNWQ